MGMRTAPRPHYYRFVHLLLPQLAAVKTEWTKYGDLLDAVQKKINQASETIDQVKVRSRAIGRKLKDVQELPKGEASAALLESTVDEYGEENDGMTTNRLQVIR